jgi:hypothetical protein
MRKPAASTARLRPPPDPAMLALAYEIGRAIGRQYRAIQPEPEHANRRDLRPVLQRPAKR